MIQVEFRSVSQGKCGWCQKERDDVFTVAFADKSFTGPMCKADLLRAIRMKLVGGQAEAQKPTAAGATAGNGGGHAAHGQAGR